MATLTENTESSDDREIIEQERGVEEEEEDVFFQDIYLLADHGVAIDDVEAMRKMGLNTLKGIQMTITAKLQKIKGLTDEKINKIREICSKIATGTGFITALEMCEQRRQVFKLTTGSQNIDKLLGGGIESMSVTEVFGEARLGKTQLAHTLCVTAQIPGEDSYSGGKVMFIDTENTFRPERIRDICRRFALDEKCVLENILYARAYNSEHQLDLLKKVGSKFHEEAGVFKLLIIDSIMALFRVDFTGRGEIADRQAKLGQMMSTLQKISEEYNVAVFITNQIMSDFKFSLLDAELPKPVGGHILAHASTTRIALKKLSGNKRSALIFDSPKLEEAETVFTLTNGGVADPNE